MEAFSRNGKLLLQRGFCPKDVFILETQMFPLTVGRVN